jgi:transposase InsO family protein
MRLVKHSSLPTCSASQRSRFHLAIDSARPQCCLFELRNRTLPLALEEVHRQEYGDLAEARASIERFVERIYNGKRLHSALGYRPPVEFERALTISSPQLLQPQVTA